eukprot:g17096.t1
MSAPRAWRCSASAILLFVVSTLGPVFGFVASAPKLNNVAHLRSPANRPAPTATALLPGGAAEAAGQSSLGVSRSVQVVGNEAAAAATAAGQLVLAGGVLDDLDPPKLGLFALAGLGVAAAGFSTAVYWRMQYVVAALLTNRVPVIQGGAEVLELSAKDTKTLYYMPTGGVRRLTLSTVKDLESEIVNGAAIQAKIPTALVRKQEGSKISCTSGTMDCVVSVYGFSSGVAAGSGKSGGGGSPATLKGLASEVARVLKPGGTVLFVEKGEAKELVDELREALGKVEVNMVTNLVDPYCVAMATKTKVAEEEVGAAFGEMKKEKPKAAQADETAGRNRRERRQRKKAAAAANSGRS